MMFKDRRFDHLFGFALCLLAIARRYPSLTFGLRFEEPNMGFGGEVIWAGGELKSEYWGESAFPEDEPESVDDDLSSELSQDGSG